MCYSAVFPFLALSLTLLCYCAAAWPRSPRDHSTSRIITPATQQALSAGLQVTHNYFTKPDSSKWFHINWVSLGRPVCVWNDSLPIMSQSSYRHKCIQCWLSSRSGKERESCPCYSVPIIPSSSFISSQFLSYHCHTMIQREKKKQLPVR